MSIVKNIYTKYVRPVIANFSESHGYTMKPFEAFNMNELVSIFIVVLLAAYLLPTAFSAVFNANTTGWDDGTKAIFQILPIIASVVIVAGLVYLVKRD